MHHFNNVGLYDALFVMQDQETRTLYAFVLSENEDPIQLHGYTSVARYTWVVSVIHNTLNVTHEDLISVIETLDVVPGFATEQPAEVGRLGKSIIIPPRVTL